MRKVLLYNPLSNYVLKKHGLLKLNSRPTENLNKRNAKVNILTKTFQIL